ncbi:MAG: diguanylate cyclase [Gemmatimonadaceae bacterium]
MAEPVILAAIADDLLLKTVSWFLKENGYHVLEAPDVEALFEHLESVVPDLLVLDVTAESLPGPLVLERIKADDPWSDMPVLILSAMPPDDVTVRMLGLGAADFIGKPFRVRELLARIVVQLRVRQRLHDAREELRTTELQLRRARNDAESQRKLVDILHEVTGDFAPDEIYHILVRRVARALNITHCSLILARTGGDSALVATAYESPALRNLEIRLSRYPEVQEALEREQAVLIEDVRRDPLFANVRRDWDAEGVEVAIRSVIALPFTLDLDRRQAGVFFLRTTRDELPLTQEDVEFAEAVIRAAVAAIRKAQVIETTMADKARLEQLASTDPLTQLLNRRALTERLAGELDRARRYNHALALLMVDLDHFKQVNDTYGHPVGDQVLREIADTLLREVRTVDIVARYGGEEFVVVLPEQGEEGALVFAERVRLRISGHEIRHNGNNVLCMTVSVGIASFPSAYVDSTDDLIARADEALYRAKASGRNTVRS